MENTFQAVIAEPDGTRREILVAQLAAAGFDAFEETDAELIACAPAAAADEAVLKSILGPDAVYTTTLVAPQNWNAQWEAGFEPVVVADFCTIRAHFHPAARTEHDIVITPKMSFGTGHHATTQLMVEAMREMDFKGKSVLDFGSGTGILAILALQRGATHVTGIDIDDWVTENALENGQQNGATAIRFLTGSLEIVAGERYDIILANINRHILLQYMRDMETALLPGGSLLLSGILIADAAILESAAAEVGLKLVPDKARAGWACLHFRKA